MAKRYDSLIRLILVGATGVGKTCMICQYANNEFSTSHVTTLGVDFKMKIINLDGKNVKMQIWDTAGQERFESITKQFYTRAQGCILVYDITCRSSFESLAKWLLYVKQYANQDAAVIMVGNKTDLEARRQVPTSTAQQFARENGLLFYEVSSKDPNSLQQPFSDICREILQLPEKPLQNGSMVDLNKSKTTQEGETASKESHRSGCRC